jgi:hypothetical protein
MVTVIEPDQSRANAFRKFGSDFAQGQKNRSDEMALKKAIEGLGANPNPRDLLNAITGTTTYSNEAKQQALKNYIGVQEFEELKRKTQAQEEIAKEKNKIAALKLQNDENRQKQVDNLVSQGFDYGEAEAITNPHVPNSVKQGISKRVESELARGLRNKQPQIQTETPQEAQTEPNQPITPETKETSPEGQEIAPENEIAEPTIQSTKEPAKPQWPDIPPPPETTAADRVKWRDKNQTFNNKLLKETKDQTKAHKDALLKYNVAKNYNESHKLPSGIGSIVIDPETGDIRPVASLLGLVNKETQAFVKTINDFLSGAQNFFGGRVTNFEIGTFKSRLPSLLNTEDGRRLIIEQMKLMEQLQLNHDKTLEDALKHYGSNASYSDIQSIVDEKEEEQDAPIIAKLNVLDEASNKLDVMAKDPKFKDTILMQSKEGVFKAVPKSKVNDAKAKGYVQW